MTTQQTHIDDATWQAMQEAKAVMDQQAIERVFIDRSEELILKAATDGLEPAEIEQSRSLDARQRQKQAEADERREQSEI